MADRLHAPFSFISHVVYRPNDRDHPCRSGKAQNHYSTDGFPEFIVLSRALHLRSRLDHALLLYYDEDNFLSGGREIISALVYEKVHTDGSFLVLSR